VPSGWQQSGGDSAEHLGHVVEEDEEDQSGNDTICNVV
jgi:hypothetical protein